MTASFPPTQRLLSAGDYRNVFSAPDYRKGQREILLLARFNDRPSHRLGLAIAKKHVPTAVKRNLIKRLAREHFRHLPELRRALDIVVLTRPAANGSDRRGLRNALQRQFDHLLRSAREAAAL